MSSFIQLPIELPIDCGVGLLGPIDCGVGLLWYKAPPKRVLSEEDRITVNMGGTLAPTAAPGGIAGAGVTVLADVSAHNAGKAIQ